MALPSDYADLSGWWSADSGYYNSYPTLATNGQTVSRWDDRSSGARNLVNYSSGGYPTWQSNIINGLPAIRTVPNQDFYSTAFTGQVAFLQSPPNNGGTAFCVSRTTNASAYQPWIFWDGTFGTETTMQHNADGTVQSFAYNVFTGTRPGTASAWMLCTWMASGSTVYCGNLDTRTASLVSATYGGNLYNGNFYTRSAGAFEYKEIAEMIFYKRALTEAERMGVESYLAAKYALSIPYGTGGFMVIG